MYTKRRRGFWGVVNFYLSLLSAYWVLSAYFLAVLEISICGFWGCGQFLSFIIKHILGIKRIFPCSFGNKHMCLLTRVYGM